MTKTEHISGNYGAQEWCLQVFHNNSLVIKALPRVLLHTEARKPQRWPLYSPEKHNWKQRYIRRVSPFAVDGWGREGKVFRDFYSSIFFVPVACSRRSDSGGETRKDARSARRGEGAPNPHAYYSLATLRASRVFSRRSPTIQTPGTGYCARFYFLRRVTCDQANFSRSSLYLRRSH